jgi:hypothetical protein
MSATFEEAIQPLLDAYAALDADVQELEQQLAELRDRRNRLKTAVRAVAPERLPEEPKRNRKSKEDYISATVLEMIREALARTNGGQFTPKSLYEEELRVQMASDTVRRGLNKLHEYGEVRLVRRGKGGQKTYEVIR